MKEPLTTAAKVDSGVPDRETPDRRPGEATGRNLR